MLNNDQAFRDLLIKILLFFYAKPRPRKYILASFARKSKAVKYHLSILFGLFPLSVSALCMLDGLVWDQEDHKGAPESHPFTMKTK